MVADRVGLKIWTVDEVDRLVSSGVVEDPEHYELLDGEIFEKMGQEEPHWLGVRFTMRALQRIFGIDQPMVVQGPLKLGVRDAPEPDIAFMTRDAIRPERGEVLLVVEVGVDSLARDLGRKAALYARHGVPDYWVLDVVGRRLIIHREPDTAQSRYGRIVSLTEGGTTDLLARPDARVAVADLLPVEAADGFTTP